MKKIIPALAIFISALTSGYDTKVDVIAGPKTAQEKLVGTWSGSQINEAAGYEYHFKITRRSDQSVTVQGIYLDTESKEFSYDEGDGNWKIVGTYYVESYPRELLSYRYKIINIGDERFVYYILGEEESSIELSEIPKEKINTESVVGTDYEIPKPPAGYSKAQ